MKAITLHADENLIASAHRCATANRTTLNEQFQVWLKDYVQRNGDCVQRENQAAEAMKVIRDLQGSIFTGGRKFTREEMNER